MIIRWAAAHHFVGGRRTAARQQALTAGLDGLGWQDLAACMRWLSLGMPGRTQRRQCWAVNPCRSDSGLSWGPRSGLCILL
jgi:hypothetical protein